MPSFFSDTLSFIPSAFYIQSNPHSYANPVPLPSCPAPAAPAAVGPLKQFRQKGLHHLTAVDDEERCQNRHADAAADQTSLGMPLLVLMALNTASAVGLSSQDTKIKNNNSLGLLTGAQLKWVSIVRMEILMTQVYWNLYSPRTHIPFHTLPRRNTAPCDHLAQHPESGQRGLVLLPFRCSNTDGQPDR